MALKTSNKNRKKNVLVESLEDVAIETHQNTLAAITELADINKDITSRSVVWTVVGGAIVLAALVFII